MPPACAGRSTAAATRNTAEGNAVGCTDVRGATGGPAAKEPAQYGNRLVRPRDRGAVAGASAP
jgi:hypothetical protein